MRWLLVRDHLVHHRSWYRNEEGDGIQGGQIVVADPFVERRQQRDVDLLVHERLCISHEVRNEVDQSVEDIPHDLQDIAYQLDSEMGEDLPEGELLGIGEDG